MTLLVAWVLLTIPVFFVGTAVLANCLDGRKPVTTETIWVGVILAVVPWWAVYFVILTFVR